MLLLHSSIGMSFFSSYIFCSSLIYVLLHILYLFFLFLLFLYLFPYPLPSSPSITLTYFPSPSSLPSPHHPSHPFCNPSFFHLEVCPPYFFLLLLHLLLFFFFHPSSVTSQNLLRQFPLHTHASSTRASSLAWLGTLHTRGLTGCQDFITLWVEL